MQFSWSTQSAEHRPHALYSLAWHDGLQLLPQHFQYIDSRLDAQLRHHLSVLHPNGWGLNRLHVNESALKLGKLQVDSAAGCFSDSLVFDFDSNNSEPLSLNVQNNNEPVKYCLALARADVTQQGFNVLRFKQVASEPIADVNNRDEKASLIQLIPNLALREYEPSSTLYYQIPIIEIAKTPSGFVSTGYHPPSVRLIPNSKLVDGIRDAAKSLRRKAVEFSPPVVEFTVTTGSKSNLEWIFGGLVSILPVMEALVSTTDMHPQDVHRTLCSAVGVISSVAGTLPPYLPHYDHLKISESISPHIEYISNTIDGLKLVVNGWSTTAFKSDGDTWRLPLPENTRSGELLLELVFDQRTPELTATDWIKNVLMCYAHQRAKFRNLRVKGLSRKIELNGVHMGLSSAPGSFLVRVNCADTEIESELQLVIDSPDLRSDITLKSVSLLERSSHII